MAQVHPAVRAVDHSWLRVLLRAVVACRGTLPLPRQQVPQLLVGREHAGQGGMHRLQGACGRWPGASMVAVGAQELILKVHVQEANRAGATGRLCAWATGATYCTVSTEVVCISEEVLDCVDWRAESCGRPIRSPVGPTSCWHACSHNNCSKRRTTVWYLLSQ